MRLYENGLRAGDADFSLPIADELPDQYFELSRAELQRILADLRKVAYVLKPFYFIHLLRQIGAQEIMLIFQCFDCKVSQLYNLHYRGPMQNFRKITLIVRIFRGMESRPILLAGLKTSPNISYVQSLTKKICLSYSNLLIRRPAFLDRYLLIDVFMAASNTVQVIHHSLLSGQIINVIKSLVLNLRSQMMPSYLIPSR